jgi:hypothetical protein
VQYGPSNCELQPTHGPHPHERLMQRPAHTVCLSSVGNPRCMHLQRQDGSGVGEAQVQQLQAVPQQRRWITRHEVHLQARYIRGWLWLELLTKAAPRGSRGSHQALLPVPVPVSC